MHPPPPNDHSGPLGYFHMFNDITGIPVWVQIAVLGVLMAMLVCGCRKRGCCSCGGSTQPTTQTMGFLPWLALKIKGKKVERHGQWTDQQQPPPPPPSAHPNSAFDGHAPSFSLAAPPYGYGARPKVYKIEDMRSPTNFGEQTPNGADFQYPASLKGGEYPLPVAVQSAEKHEFQPRSPVPRPNGGPQPIPRPDPAARVGNPEAFSPNTYGQRYWGGSSGGGNARIHPNGREYTTNDVDVSINLPTTSHLKTRSDNFWHPIDDQHNQEAPRNVDPRYDNANTFGMDSFDNNTSSYDNYNNYQNYGQSGQNDYQNYDSQKGRAYPSCDGGNREVRNEYQGEVRASEAGGNEVRANEVRANAQWQPGKTSSNTSTTYSFGMGRKKSQNAPVHHEVRSRGEPWHPVDQNHDQSAPRSLGGPGSGKGGHRVFAG